MVLDYTYVLFSTIMLIVFVVPLYIYRKRIFKKLYIEDDFTLFIRDIKIFLRINYPLIPFEYSIVDDLQKEPNSTTKEILVIENLNNQFTFFDYSPQTQNNIPSDFLWDTYQKNSKPLKSKLPADWSRRKDLAWKRDNKFCKRCGHETSFDSAQIAFVKPIEEGGTYHFENLYTLCSDCYRLLNSEDKNKTAKSLDIYDKMMQRVAK